MFIFDIIRKEMRINMKIIDNDSLEIKNTLENRFKRILSKHGWFNFAEIVCKVNKLPEVKIIDKGNPPSTIQVCNVSANFNGPNYVTLCFYGKDILKSKKLKKYDLVRIKGKIWNRFNPIKKTSYFSIDVEEWEKLK